MSESFYLPVEALFLWEIKEMMNVKEPSMMPVRCWHA